MENKERPPVYYSEYLQLDKILNAQFPESDKEGIKADDEMMFIVIHQSYELWFKQILHELSIIRSIFKQEEIPNNSPDIYNCVHRIKRICTILGIAVEQMSIMETMTPLDFLEFRDLLRPASGFQSIQFKMIEATLGLNYNDRHGHNYYLSQLNEDDIKRVKDAEAQESLLVLINRWLERMPFLKDNHIWPENWFWDAYRNVYNKSLLEAEKGNTSNFDMLFMNNNEYPDGRRLSTEANRSALFIMMYRDYPMLHMPFELISSLLEIDELLSLWRHRHIHMVQRTIGKRVGTGGSTGSEYLQKAADSHIIFKELAELTTFLVPRHSLPPLPEQLAQGLGYK
ncbi:MAG: tryptophan 2,3-dioxygenase [Chitinophagales bacterium]|nr:tryptophan 2,3-dioxygenase [Chitinophagaceae bacterium]MCB9065693.1 tryptophan 2,3-dioxygenase [Chitinophagales bacterium]